MRAYGVRRADRGCCPGHDKFPRDRYKSNRSLRAHRRARVYAHGRARMLARAYIHCERTQGGAT
jgi:hypothetical protein